MTAEKLELAHDHALSVERSGDRITLLCESPTDLLPIELTLAEAAQLILLLRQAIRGKDT